LFVVCLVFVWSLFVICLLFVWKNTCQFAKTSPKTFKMQSKPPPTGSIDLTETLWDMAAFPINVRFTPKKRTLVGAVIDAICLPAKAAFQVQLNLPAFDKAN
jgi:hypothetical protein